MRYCEMDWTDEGAKCKTNIQGFCCPRCGKVLDMDVEHLCGSELVNRLEGTTKKLAKGLKLARRVSKI